MNKYYKSNAIYDSITDTSRFKWVSGNAWALIYGDNNSTPKVLAFVCGKSWPSDQELISAIQQISKKSNIPCIQIIFDDKANEIQNVDFSEDWHTFETISLEELKEHFARLGVPVNQSLCSKAINSQLSSAYHMWQRSSLGKIVVSDIDLIHLSESGEVSSIIELKRSIYSIDRWQPFSDDFANFKLISNVCNQINAKFKICYNVRTKNPFNDDPSILKIFTYSQNLQIENVKVIPLSDFLNSTF